MFQKNRKKYKLVRKYFLFISIVILISLFLLIWVKIFLEDSDNQSKYIVENNVTQEKELDEDFAQRVDSLVEEFSCDAKNEKLIKGVIKKISNNYFIINDLGREYKIYIKPETLFLRVYVLDKNRKMEINFQHLRPQQSVVASVFENSEGEYFSLLVKQIIDKKNDSRN
jgi:hypothetical protein